MLQLSAEELEQNYLKEVENLKEMMPEENEENANVTFMAELEQEWKELEVLLKPVTEEIEEDTENRSSPDSLMGEDDTKER